MAKDTPEIVKKLKTIRTLLGDDTPTNDKNGFMMKILNPQTVAEALDSVEFHGFEVRNSEILFKFVDMIDDLIEQMPQALAENERRQLAKHYLK